MNCVHCKGALSRSTAPLQIERSGYSFGLAAAPAWVCAECGEASFGERVVDIIQDTIHTLDEHTRRISEGAA